MCGRIGSKRAFSFFAVVYCIWCEESADQRGSHRFIQTRIRPLHADNMQIPEKYKWQAGTHGSAWKYCCSLIGAAPTPYYKAGEALMNHDYDKVLKNRIHDKSVPVRDTYQQLKTAQKKKDEVVQYKLGDAVTHPKFGHGIVEKINQRSGGVHLHIRFDGEVKCIDQKWLSRKKYT